MVEIADLYNNVVVVVIEHTTYMHRIDPVVLINKSTYYRQKGKNKNSRTCTCRGTETNLRDLRCHNS